jgi:uncharacterized protein YdeI (YjbR/CyaY-like superfamily)
MTEHKSLPVLDFADAAAWRAWLDTHGATSGPVWLCFAKAGSGLTSVGKAEAIELALAYGWIDGQIDALDDKRWLTRFSRRGPDSRWSKINRATAEKLIAAGRMTPAGLAEVERAKASGRWDTAYVSQKTAEPPDDLMAALDAAPAAKAFFATLTGANRYAVIYRVQDAKKPETRRARIEKFVAMLERGETLHPAKDKSGKA